MSIAGDVLIMPMGTTGYPEGLWLVRKIWAVHEG